MNIYEKALAHYGTESQINKCVEELAELSVQLMKHQNGANNVDAIAEELCDVKIMLEQMELAFNVKSAVSVYIGQKLARLEKRIEGERWKG